MTDYRKMREEKRQRKAEREELLKKKYKERLQTIIEKKLKTTMVGAINSIEKHFGFLWEGDKEDLSPTELEIREIFEEARKEIFDLGNKQIRNMKEELENYEVEWKRYKTYFKPSKNYNLRDIQKD